MIRLVVVIFKCAVDITTKREGSLCFTMVMMVSLFTSQQAAVSDMIWQKIRPHFMKKQYNLGYTILGAINPINPNPSTLQLPSQLIS